MKRRDYLNVLLLIILFLLIVVFLKKQNFLYGSTTDWLNQHVTLAEYFRTLFYDTKQLIPSFAFNISGGVNIFTLSYYGLLNPIILISYLLPMVSMTNYIQISSIVITIFSIALFYVWIKKHFNSNLSLLSTFIFLCATPIIFHSHRHIMFINYMPFMIMALMGVERYFEKKKSGLLIISTFLIIMTSYFYSVGCILGIVIYGIYYYLKDNKVTFKQFMTVGFKFAIRILISVLMAAVLLLPTAYVILNGRIETNVNLSLIDILLPSSNPQLALYDSYSMGFTSIFVIAIILNVLSNKKERIFLGIFFLSLIFIPIITYLLNGGMYLNGKALIPFVPLGTYLIIFGLKDLYEKKFDLKKLLISILIINILFIGYEYYYVFIIDVLLMIFGILFIDRKYILTFLIICISFSITLFRSNKDTLVKKEVLKAELEKQEIYDNIIYDGYRTVSSMDSLMTINKIYNANQYMTTSYSSTLNKNYLDFYYETFENENLHRNFLMIGRTQNILFHMFMGSKYMIGNPNMIGYEKIDNLLYENKDVFPIGYASSNLMSNNDFNKLNYPDNVNALLKNIVVDKRVENDFVSDFEKIDLKYEVVERKNLDVSETNDGYVIDSKKGNMKLKVDNLDNKILVVKFDIANNQKCEIGDLAITINGIKNTLTCEEWKYYNNNKTFTYVLSKDNDKLNIQFKKGKYVIKNIKFYAIDYDKIKYLNKDVDPFNVDMNKTKGDKIVGDIDVKEDGYFTISIPYDKGFNIYVDDKKVDYEMVNTAFLGFRIDKGKHHIEIEYDSPFLKEGKIISLIGLLLLILVLCYERKRV